MAKKTATMARSGELLVPAWEFCVFGLLILLRGRLLRRVLRACGVADDVLEQTIGRRVDGPLWIFLLALGLVPFALTLASVIGAWPTIALTTLALALAFHIIIQCLDLIVFSWYADQKNAQISKVVRTVFVSVLYGIATLLVLDWGFGVSVLPLLATSTILTAVLGLAMQDTIKNVVAGLNIALEKRIVEGDWVILGLDGKLTLDGKNSLYGQIVEVGWRSTKIRTVLSTEAIIPNADLIGQKLINLSKPASMHAIEIDFPTDWQIDPGVVKLNILAVAKAVPGVLVEPEPQVMPISLGNELVSYRLRFWIGQVELREQATAAMLEAVWPVLKDIRPVVSAP